MSKEINYQVSKDVDQIEELLSNLTRKVMLDESLSVLSKEQYSKIFNQFKMLDTSIYDHKTLSIDSNDRLEMLTDVMSSIAELDFTITAEIENESDYNHLDYIALSLNLMRDRLEDKYKSLLLVQTAFNTLEDLLIITDKDGTVLLANDPLEKVYHVKMDDVIGQNIRTFFQHDEMAPYHIDFSSCLPLSEQFDTSVSGKTPKHQHVMIKVSNQVVHLQGGYGLMYKILPVSIRRNSTDEGVELTKKYRELIANFSDQLEVLLEGSIKNALDKDSVLSQIRQIFEDKPRKNLTETAILRALEDLE